MDEFDTIASRPTDHRLEVRNVVFGGWGPSQPHFLSCGMDQQAGRVSDGYSIRVARKMSSSKGDDVSTQAVGLIRVDAVG